MATEGSPRAVVTALGANLAIGVSKFVAAAITGSASMLAEGVHSVADSANQVLLLIGGRRAPPAAAAPITGSPSMRAEGVHSVADSANQVLLLIGGRRARRPASALHQFGYARE